MTIPLAQLRQAQDLLLFGPLDTQLEPILDSEWDQQRNKVCREYDLFTRVTLLPSTAGRAIYSTPADTVRIFTVLFRGRTLGYTDRMNLDIVDPNWENADPSEPKYWSQNIVPGDFGSPTVAITPREFLIYPAPDGANAGTDTIAVISQYAPATIPTTWMYPILLYLTVARQASENPSCMQPEKGKWFYELARLWLETTRKLMEV